MKKGLSILLVLTLLASMLVPFPVHATSGNTLPSEVTVKGTGGVTTMSTYGDILGGRLPTSANLHFTIDPLNLLEVQVNQPIDIDARNTAVNFGDNNVLQAWSTSSVETLLTVTLQLNQTGANPVLTEAGITSGDVNTSNNILMWMEPSASYRTASDAPFAGLGQVVPYGANAVPVQFRLQERPHDVVKTGVTDGSVVTVELKAKADAPAQFGTAFRFGGIINADSTEWGKAALSVSAVFSIVKAEGTALNAALRTDGDVTGDSRMIVGHAASPPYVAPTLIPLPAGGGASGGNQQFTAENTGWVRITGVNATPAVGGVQINGAAGWVGIGSSVVHTAPYLWVELPAGQPGPFTIDIFTVIAGTSNMELARTVTAVRP